MNVNSRNQTILYRKKSVTCYLVNEWQKLIQASHVGLASIQTTSECLISCNNSTRGLLWLFCCKNLRQTCIQDGRKQMEIVVLQMVNVISDKKLVYESYFYVTKWLYGGWGYIYIKIPFSGPNPHTFEHWFKVETCAVLTNRKLLLFCWPQLDKWDFLLVNAAWGFDFKFHAAQSLILIGPVLAGKILIPLQGCWTVWQIATHCGESPETLAVWSHSRQSLRQ